MPNPDQVVRKGHAKTITIIMLVFMSFAALVFYFGILPERSPLRSDSVKIDGMLLPKPQDITHFSLTDNKGKSFTKKSLMGHWTMMFFGFTNCGEVCPTTMSELNKMMVSLKAELPADQLPQVVMVSVDAQRDSIQRINSYVTAFNPDFRGARGSQAEMLALEKQLHIVSARMQADGQGEDHYTINHSAEIILFNPAGQVQAFLSYPHKSEQMIQDYKAILSSVKKPV